MKKRKRVSGDQYLHREDPENVEKIKTKMKPTTRISKSGNIAQGIMQILALEMPHHIAALDCRYRRTVCELPTEATVAAALQSSAWIFDGMPDDPEQCVNQMLNAMTLSEQVELESADFEALTGT